MLCVLPLLITTCQEENRPILKLKESDERLTLRNGILYFKKRVFTGFLVTYFPKGDLRSKIEYKDGRKHGFEQQWFTNGKLALDRHYTKGKKTGVHRAWWEKGSPKFTYHFNHSGEYHGSVKEWYPSGRLYRYFNYTNGKETGRQQLWKDDGSIKANYQVVEGERFGLIGLKKCYTVTSNSTEIR
ncbi:hypothetical protein GWK08_11940 [Leptobacterium flavescens]|uniref:Toxin-antitoxin system YwqK family antitoxin n=2 Tax=Leptobacterium flavescens TaxID=472055 RepID=A0A6P0UUR9_9FLAO|nr:hypothetical protein [Leptobacterium flavescens]